MIKLESVSCDLTTSRIRTRAVDNVSLQIEGGDFVSITGPSGAGKSTLLSLVGLLQRPSAGRIAAFGEFTEKLPYRHLARLRRENIGFVFQSFFLLPELSVLQNVELAARLLGRSKYIAAQKRARDLLSRLGLSAREQHYPQQLSGGQQQRVALARALVTQPKLLVADEPTGNLDHEAGSEVLRIFDELVREGVAVCLVSHDKNVCRMAPRRYRMDGGHLAEVVEEAASC